VKETATDDTARDPEKIITNVKGLVLVKEDEAVLAIKIRRCKEDPAEESHLCIGMFHHRALNTLHRFSTKLCKQLDKSRPT
jgi:hypothetical protein